MITTQTDFRKRSDGFSQSENACCLLQTLSGFLDLECDGDGM